MKLICRWAIGFKPINIWRSEELVKVEFTN